MHIGREKIISMAVELFQEKGYRATTVQDIANKCGVTKAALYYYIQSKEEILWEIFDQTMTTAEQRMDGLMKENVSLEQRLKAIVSNHIMNVRDDSPYMTIFFTEKAHLPRDKQEQITNRRRQYENKIAEIFEQGIREGVLKPLPVLPTVYGLLGMCNWMYQWYNPNGKLSAEEIAKVYTEILLQGLLNKDKAN
ncbi:MAG: TetR/AcrR family transcriptional regulator [Desulfitobacteriaceae bacterium]